jgi:hypothetical protein
MPMGCWQTGLYIQYTYYTISSTNVQFSMPVLAAVVSRCVHTTARILRHACVSLPSTAALMTCKRTAAVLHSYKY